jgi:hypothetical protein
MTMQAAVADVGTKVKTAVDNAATAYDDLMTELKQPTPDSAVVLSRSGDVWTWSLKAWANLVLAPGTIAAAIANDAA